MFRYSFSFGSCSAVQHPIQLNILIVPLYKCTAIPNGRTFYLNTFEMIVASTLCQSNVSCLRVCILAFVLQFMWNKCLIHTALWNIEQHMLLHNATKKTSFVAIFIHLLRFNCRLIPFSPKIAFHENLYLLQYFAS